MVVVRRRAYTKTRARKVRTSKAATLSKSVTKAVQKIVRKDIEDKYQIGTLDDTYWNAIGADLPTALGAFSSGFPVWNRAYAILPQVPQGLDLASRTGDVIRPKSLSLDWSFSLNYNQPSALVINCRLMCLVDRSVKSNTALTTIPLSTDLFYREDSRVAGVNGYPIEQNYRINTKRFQVLHDKHFVLEKSAGSYPQSSNGYAGTTAVGTNRQVHRMRTIIKCPQTLKYDPTGIPTGSRFPSNFAPFWCMTWSMPNNDTGGSSGGGGGLGFASNLVMAQFVSHLVYEDA